MLSPFYPFLVDLTNTYKKEKGIAANYTFLVAFQEGQKGLGRTFASLQNKFIKGDVGIALSCITHSSDDQKWLASCLGRLSNGRPFHLNRQDLWKMVLDGRHPVWVSDKPIPCRD